MWFDGSQLFSIDFFGGLLLGFSRFLLIFQGSYSCSKDCYWFSNKICIDFLIHAQILNDFHRICIDLLKISIDFLKISIDSQMFADSRIFVDSHFLSIFVLFVDSQCFVDFQICVDSQILSIINLFCRFSDFYWFLEFVADSQFFCVWSF